MEDSDRDNIDSIVDSNSIDSSYDDDAASMQATSSQATWQNTQGSSEYHSTQTKHLNQQTYTLEAPPVDLQSIEESSDEENMEVDDTHEQISDDDAELSDFIDDENELQIDAIDLASIESTLTSEEKELYELDITTTLSPPKRPQQPYFMFSGEIREQVRTELGSTSVTDIAREIGSRWAALTSEEKQVYIDRTAAEKAIYDEKHAEYQQSMDQRTKAIALRERLFSLPGSQNQDADLESETNSKPFNFGILPVSRIKSIIQSDPGARFTKESVDFITKASELFASYIGVLISRYSLVTRKVSIRNAFWQHMLLSNPEMHFLKHCHFLFESQFEASKQDLAKQARAEQKLGKHKEHETSGLVSIRTAFETAAVTKHQENDESYESNKTALRITGNAFQSLDPFSSMSTDQLFGSSKKAPKKTRAKKTSTNAAAVIDSDIELDDSNVMVEPKDSKKKATKSQSITKSKAAPLPTTSTMKSFFQNDSNQPTKQIDQSFDPFASDNSNSTKSRKKTTTKAKSKKTIDDLDDYIEGVDYILNEAGERVFHDQSLLQETSTKVAITNVNTKFSDGNDSSDSEEFEIIAPPVKGSKKRQLIDDEFIDDSDDDVNKENNENSIQNMKRTKLLDEEKLPSALEDRMKNKFDQFLLKK